VYEGEFPLVTQNRLLGKFTLQGLPPRPRGQLQIFVTFTISTDGILLVSAKVNDGEKDISGSLTIDQDKGLLTPHQVTELKDSLVLDSKRQELISRLMEFGKCVLISLFPESLRD
jgi:molecular chaperone DnaK (HSP70)